VGDLASTTRDDILAVPGLGAGKLQAVLRALHSRADAQSGTGGIATLDSLWDRLVAPLTDRQRLVLDAVVGMTVPARRQVDIAASLGISQPAVSVQLKAATNKIDRRVFETPRDYVVRMVRDLGGGAMSASEAASRLLEKWEGEPERAHGWLHLIAFLATDRLALHTLDDLQHPTLTRATLTKADLAVFVKEARRQAQWPPKPPEASRRAVRMVIPEDRLPGDPLTVAVRLLEDVASTDRGELFAPPLSAAHAVKYALETERPPLSIERLRERVAEAFGPDAPAVHDSALQDILQPLGLRVEGGRILDVDLASVQTDAALLQGDALPMALAQDPGEQVAAMLEAARAHRGFRMLVVPPREHRTIAASVARRLGVPLTSFAHCWFEQHEGQLDALEKAERFKAQRRKLSRAADDTFDALLEAHGTPGTTTVVGDLAILGVLDAHDLIRRWYDEVKGGRLMHYIDDLHFKKPIRTGRTINDFSAMGRRKGWKPPPRGPAAPSPPPPAVRGGSDVGDDAIHSIRTGRQINDFSAMCRTKGWSGGPSPPAVRWPTVQVPQEEEKPPVSKLPDMKKTAANEFLEKLVAEREQHRATAPSGRRDAPQLPSAAAEETRTSCGTLQCVMGATVPRTEFGSLRFFSLSL
jgi:hypothetical protein